MDVKREEGDVRGEEGGKRRYGESTQDYPSVFTTIPPPIPEAKLGQLTKEQLRQFFEDGFCVVENYFTPEELEPCRQAVAGLVENLAQKLYKAGKIDSLYEEFGLFQRLTELEKAFPGANILLFKDGKLPKAFMDVWSDPRMLNMVEQIIGPDVAGHPVWNLRVKTPHNKATDVPWHQDAAYFSEESYDHMVVTAWIPFLDTNANNGGMQCVRGGHRLGRVSRHTCCAEDFWYVMLEEDDIEKTLGADMEKDIVMCDVPYGGFLLFNNITPHRSLRNLSNEVRWSIDLRWQSPHEKWGFYDIQDGILFRTKEDGDVTPDWEKFLSVNRKVIWQTKFFKEVDEKRDPFDTTVTGPWIGRWEIVNHNKHTKSFQSQVKTV